MPEKTYKLVNMQYIPHLKRQLSAVIMDNKTVMTVKKSLLGRGKNGQVRMLGENYIVKSGSDRWITVKNEEKFENIIHGPNTTKAFFFLYGKAIKDNAFGPDDFEALCEFQYRLIRQNFKGDTLSTAYKKYHTDYEKIILLYILTAQSLIDKVHSKKIVHGDIHSDNFIVLEDCSDVIPIDFGCSYFLEDEKGIPGYATIREGKCRYWSPDRVTYNEEKVTANLKQDVFSFGYMLSKYPCPSLSGNLTVLNDLFFHLTRMMCHSIDAERPHMQDVLAYLTYLKNIFCHVKDHPAKLKDTLFKLSEFFSFPIREILPILQKKEISLKEQDIKTDISRIPMNHFLILNRITTTPLMWSYAVVDETTFDKIKTEELQEKTECRVITDINLGTLDPEKLKKQLALLAAHIDFQDNVEKGDLPSSAEINRVAEAIKFACKTLTPKSIFKFANPLSSEEYKRHEINSQRIDDALAKEKGYRFPGGM